MQDYEKNGLKIITEYISCEYEKEILLNIGECTKRINGNGRNSVKRYGSDLPYKSNMVDKKIPEYLDNLAEMIFQNRLLDIKPNSISINEYQVGQGIVPHIDSKSSGEVITVLSLLSDAKMTFSKGKEKFDVNVPARSLLMMSGEIRNFWNHGIEKVESLRYSIVFRNGIQVK